MHMHNNHIADNCDMDSCTDMEHWFSADGCRLSECPILSPEPTKLYKVVISNETAEDMLEDSVRIPYELFVGRKSPIVFYCDLTDREAIDIASNNSDITVTRAPADWSI